MEKFTDFFAWYQKILLSNLLNALMDVIEFFQQTRKIYICDCGKILRYVEKYKAKDKTFVYKIYV